MSVVCGLALERARVRILLLALGFGLFEFAPDAQAEKTFFAVIKNDLFIERAERRDSFNRAQIVIGGKNKSRFLF